MTQVHQQSPYFSPQVSSVLFTQICGSVRSSHRAMHACTFADVSLLFNKTELTHLLLLDMHLLIF